MSKEQVETSQDSAQPAVGFDAKFDQAAEKALAEIEKDTTEEAKTTETDTEQTAKKAKPVAKTAGQESEPKEAGTNDEKTPDVPSTEDGLLKPEEIAKLSKGQKETYKLMNAAFTQKTQQLSADRKALEAERAEVGDYKNFVSALKADPKSVIGEMAKRAGIKLADEGAVPATKVPGAITAKLKTALGEDFDFVSDKLGPILEEVLAGATAQSEQLAAEKHKLAVESDTDKALAQFSAKHSDFPQHEKKMAALMDKFPLGPKTEYGEYLETLYEIATKDTRYAEEAKKELARQARALEGAESGKSGISSSHVTPKLKSKGFNARFDEAGDLALVQLGLAD